jgi:hypothetical protein
VPVARWHGRAQWSRAVQTVELGKPPAPIRRRPPTSSGRRRGRTEGCAPARCSSLP